MSTKKNFGYAFVRDFMVAVSPFILFFLFVIGGYATARLPGADTTYTVVYWGTTYVVAEGNVLLPEQREALELEDNDILLLGPSFFGIQEVFKVTNSDLRRELRGAKSARVMEFRLVEREPMSIFRWAGPDYYYEEQVLLIDGERRVFKNALEVWFGPFNFSTGKHSNTPARGAHAPRAVFFISRLPNYTTHFTYTRSCLVITKPEMIVSQPIDFV